MEVKHMKKGRQLTEFGLAVKKALLDKQITQKDFCIGLGIPVNRFTEILYGLRPGLRYRRQIAEALGIGAVSEKPSRYE
jgi:transcriptional regulator with XRE-family HTH domain